jgi:ubiquinone/menaquinone biosynthesis C-methylase UbiE
MNTHADIERMSLLYSEVYPYIAHHITEKFGIVKGNCLDIGSGAGSLGIALAKITNLYIVSLDSDSAAIDVTVKNILFQGLAHRMMVVKSDVHDTPFPDNSFDLIVSRGSVFFWEDLPGAIKEISRILKPGGVIFCGGGLGSAEISRRIQQRIDSDIRFQKSRNNWRETSNVRDKGQNTAYFINAIAATGLKGSVVFDCEGIWIEMSK